MKCSHPDCEKEGTSTISGGGLPVCDDHKGLAEFIYMIYDEAEFHRNCE